MELKSDKARTRGDLAGDTYIMLPLDIFKDVYSQKRLLAL